MGDVLQQQQSILDLEPSYGHLNFIQRSWCCGWRPVDRVDSTVRPPPAGPTGQVNAGIAGNFLMGTTPAPANFIFDTLSGTIDAWNGAQGTSAVVAVPNTTGASYTGLTLANNGTGNFLYAANFTVGGGINVFNSSFASTTLAGSFTDPNVPAGYAPYNVQTLNGKLYVEYGEVGPTGHPVTGSGLGYIGVFDLNGHFLPGDPGNLSNAHLNVPWGITFAPAGFGSFGGDLLIGNFGDGTVSAFDPNTGDFAGTLTDANGNPIVNSDLWALDFRTNGGSGSNPNALYFDAGINGEADGLFGEIVATPEPGTWTLGILGILGMAAVYLRKTNRKCAS